MIHIKTLFGTFLFLSAVYVSVYWTNSFSSSTLCKYHRTRNFPQKIHQSSTPNQVVLDTIINQPLRDSSSLEILATRGGKARIPQSSIPQTNNSSVQVSNSSSKNDVTPKCRPVEHILFLKTHKTGSSTITNILNRFGDSRNLSFALPAQGNLYTFIWPTRFRLTYVAPLYGMADYNILCNHARYNRRPMNWLFPKQRTKYISILREPTAQYESVFNFMHFATSLGYNDENDPLGTFLKFPLPFQEIKPRMKKTNVALHLVRNPMLFDLGLDFRYYQNLTAVKNYFQFLEQEFDLIMIMEHFDESLVLMKRLLCWSMADILYFKLNERQEKQKRKHLSKHVRQDIRSWNQADFMLYEHFNKTLWRKIEEQGPDFYTDLETFRRENKALRKTCLQKGYFLDEAYSGVFVKGYAIRKDIPTKQKRQCEKLVRNEISYVKHFRHKRIKGIKRIEEPDEYLDDPQNDWERGTDLEHEPNLSGFDPTLEEDQLGTAANPLSGR